MDDLSVGDPLSGWLQIFAYNWSNPWYSCARPGACIYAATIEPNTHYCYAKFDATPIEKIVRNTQASPATSN